MIACPKCQAKTVVLETRGATRNRMCTSCTSKFITMETAITESDPSEETVNTWRRLAKNGDLTESFKEYCSHKVATCLMKR